jgi:hypothetical protein
MTGPNNHYWLVRPATIRRLWSAFILVLIALVGLDLIVAHHPQLGIDGTPGFGAWYGFLSCVALVVLAKALGAILKRPDTYYDG